MSELIIIVFQIFLRSIRSIRRLIMRKILPAFTPYTLHPTPYVFLVDSSGMG